MKRQMLFAFLVATLIVGIFPNTKAAINPDIETQPVIIDDNGEVATTDTTSDSGSGPTYGDGLITNAAPDDLTCDYVECRCFPASR